MRHAIIRRETVTDVSRGGGEHSVKVLQYICGKIGPCQSLSQLLR